MTSRLKHYYLLQASYWIQQIFVLVLKIEKPRSDYVELCIHVRRAFGAELTRAALRHPLAHRLVVHAQLDVYRRLDLRHVRRLARSEAKPCSMDLSDTFLAVRRAFFYSR